MVQIQNTETINAIRIAARIPNHEAAPIELGRTVVPVIDISPLVGHQIQNIGNDSTGATATGLTPLTSSATRDTYVHYIHFSFIKDATCNVADGAIEVILRPFGLAAGVDVIMTEILTATAQAEEIIVNFTKPIRLTRGSAITVAANTFTLGKFRKACCVGYEEIDADISS